MTFWPHAGLANDIHRKGVFAFHNFRSHSNRKLAVALREHNFVVHFYTCPFYFRYLFWRSSTFSLVFERQVLLDWWLICCQVKSVLIQRAEYEMLQLEISASHVEYLRAFSYTRLLQPNLQYECKLQRALVVFSECMLRFICRSTRDGIWHWSFKWNIHKYLNLFYYKWNVCL
jgi:hypothetical protein